MIGRGGLNITEVQRKDAGTYICRWAVLIMTLVCWMNLIKNVVPLQFLIVGDRMMDAINAGDYLDLPSEHLQS